MGYITAQAQTDIYRQVRSTTGVFPTRQHRGTIQLEFSIKSSRWMTSLSGAETSDSSLPAHHVSCWLIKRWFSACFSLRDCPWCHLRHQHASKQQKETGAVRWSDMLKTSPKCTPHYLEVNTHLKSSQCGNNFEPMMGHLRERNTFCVSVWLTWGFVDGVICLFVHLFWYLPGIFATFTKVSEVDWFSTALQVKSILVWWFISWLWSWGCCRWQAFTARNVLYF